MKNVALVLLAGAVLVMAGFLIAPRLGLGSSKEPFDPPKMANEIMLEVGSSLASRGPVCNALEGRIGVGATETFCQESRYSPADARNKVDEISERYRVEPAADWSVDPVGYSRYYRNAEQSSSVENISQSVIVMLTSDVVIVSYDE